MTDKLVFIFFLSTKRVLTSSRKVVSLFQIIPVSKVVPKTVHGVNACGEYFLQWTSHYLTDFTEGRLKEKKIKVYIHMN